MVFQTRGYQLVKCLMVPTSRVGPRLTSSVHPCHVTLLLLCDGRIITIRCVEMEYLHKFIHIERRGHNRTPMWSSIQKQVETWRQPSPVPCQESYVSRTQRIEQTSLCSAQPPLQRHWTHECAEGQALHKKKTLHMLNPATNHGSLLSAQCPRHRHPTARQHSIPIHDLARRWKRRPTSH